MANKEISLQLDTVNKKQARFVSEGVREIEKLPTYSHSQSTVELIYEGIIYLDREVWIKTGSPSNLTLTIKEP